MAGMCSLAIPDPAPRSQTGRLSPQRSKVPSEDFLLRKEQKFQRSEELMRSQKTGSESLRLTSSLVVTAHCQTARRIESPTDRRISKESLLPKPDQEHRGQEVTQSLLKKHKSLSHIQHGTTLTDPRNANQSSWVPEATVHRCSQQLPCCSTNASTARGGSSSPHCRESR